MFARLGLILILAVTLAATALPPTAPAFPVGNSEVELTLTTSGVYRLTEVAGGPCYCPPHPHETWLVGLAHFYGEGDGYAWQVMANGERMNPQALTVAVRVDLLDTFRLGDAVRLTSACGVVTATIADTMPLIPALAQQVIVDVSPAVCSRLFCEGCGHNGEGIAYGEELILVERLREK